MPGMHGSNSDVDCVGSFRRGTDGDGGEQASRESDRAEEIQFLSADGGAEGVG